MVIGREVLLASKAKTASGSNLATAAYLSGDGSKIACFLPELAYIQAQLEC